MPSQKVRQLGDAVCRRLAISSYVAILMAFAAFTPLALCFIRSPAAVALLVLEVLTKAGRMFHGHGVLRADASAFSIGCRENMRLLFQRMCIPTSKNTSVKVALLFMPLGSKDNPWGLSFNAYAMESYRQWSNLEVVYDAGQQNTFEKGKAYVMGYEPHSPLPFGLPVFLGKHAPCRDPQLGDSRILATSLVDWVPGIRHLFHWLGGVPASRKSMEELLSRGISVCVIPGGVAECGFMKPGNDVVFLKSRFGFVRMALRHGAPLVPMFCFGQNDVYKFLRLGPPLIPDWLFERIIRKLLFCPMLIYGQWGLPLPFRARLTLIIGKPIQIPRIAEPRHEDIQKYLSVFIHQLQEMYEKHKAAAGYQHSRLSVM